MLGHTLTIRRGAVFHAHAWPLLDSTGNPVRDPDGFSVVGKIRAYPGAEHAVVLSTSLLLLTVPGAYDGIPVVAAQLNPMSGEQTAAWFDLDGHVWELAVNGDPLVGGLVSMSWAVTR